MPAPKKTLRERIVDADTRASTYLGDANEAEERGDYALAEKLMGKCQYWLDRYNLLTNQGDRPAPRV